MFLFLYVNLMGPRSNSRLTLGVKKIIMSLSDIIKPTNAQRIQGRNTGAVLFQGKTTTEKPCCILLWTSL